jgi:hypothetical protein
MAPFARRLAYASLSYSYTYPYKILADSLGEELGSLSYEPRRNLSVYISIYYRAEYGDYQ